MTITLETISNGEGYDLIPEVTKYQVATGVTVSVKEPTIALVEKANGVVGDPALVNAAICRIICQDWPEDDKEVSMRMASRLVRDFFLMLSGIEKRPQRILKHIKPGTRKPTKGWSPNRWVSAWKRRGNGFAYLVERVAGYNPAEVQRIRTLCNYTEVARCYASMCADNESFAWNQIGK